VIWMPPNAVLSCCHSLRCAAGKITQAAARYDRYHPSAVQLDAFEGASMPPHVFKVRSTQTDMIISRYDEAHMCIFAVAEK
jgi:hypothetical protein